MCFVAWFNCCKLASDRLNFDWIVKSVPNRTRRKEQNLENQRIPGSEACWAQGFALAMGEHVLVVTYMVTIHSANFSHITARQKIPLTNFWTYGYIGTSLLQHAILDNNDCCSNWIVRYMREMICIYIYYLYLNRRSFKSQGFTWLIHGSCHNLYHDLYYSLLITPLVSFLLMGHSNRAATQSIDKPKMQQLAPVVVLLIAEIADTQMILLWSDRNGTRVGDGYETSWDPWARPWLRNAQQCFRS